MIVLVVLGVLGVLMSLVLNLAGDASFSQQMLTRMVTQDRGYYAAESAVRMALSTAFARQDDSHQSLQDDWAQPTLPLQLDGYTVTVQISDEERYFNVNQLLDKKGQDDPDRIRVFRRMLDLLSQNEDFANAVLDWMDSDSDRREPGGAENLDYKDRTCKNGPLDSISEIAQIKGATPELMNGQELDSQQLPGLHDLLTIYSDGKVNVNTAPLFVLRSLSPNFDDNVAKAIMDQRLRQPFKSLDDVLNVSGVTQDDMFYLRKVADVRSETFRVEAVAVEGGDASPTPAGGLEASPQAAGAEDVTRLRVTGVFRRQGKGFTPLAWNTDEVAAPPSPAPGEAPSATASPRLNPAPSAAPRASPGGMPSFEPMR